MDIRLSARDHARPVSNHRLLGNRGLKFLQVNFLNQVGANGRRPVPTIGQIRYETNDGMSVYHALQTSLRKRFGNGLTFAAHYTWGKAITNGGGAEEGINDIQDPNNIRGSRSRTTLSVEHIANINYGWEVPLGRLLSSSPSGFARVLLLGWSLNGIIGVRSGFPLNITAGRDNFGSGQSLGQRPNYIGGDLRQGTDDYRTSNLHLYVNRAPLVQGSRGQYGNLGAWLLTGPGNVVWDFSIFKNTLLTERVNLQFRAEFFNFFNHTNLNGPNTNLNSGTFGRITGAGASREIQFGLKLIY